MTVARYPLPTLLLSALVLYPISLGAQSSTKPNLSPVVTPALTDIVSVRQSGDTRDKRETLAQILSLGSAAGLTSGPATATDNALVRFDGATGKLTQNSLLVASDTGALSGLTQLDVDNIRLDGNTIKNTDTNSNLNFDTEGSAGRFQWLVNNVIKMDFTDLGGGAFALRNQSGSMEVNAGRYFGSGGGSNSVLMANGGNWVEIKGNGTVGLRVEADRATFSGRILGAKGADAASAADITLGSGNFFTLTGTTTVNTIAATNWTAGSTVTIQCTAAVTLTHNQAGTGVSLHLASSANFGCTASDTITFIYNGTVWAEVARTAI